MSILTRNACNQLMKQEQDLSVSIVMPTHRAGAETRQDPIRFRNLVDDAERQLLEADVRSVDVQKLLKPAKELQDDRNFWQHQSAGLAFFTSADCLKCFELPGCPPQIAAVGPRFHILPLLPYLQGNGRFYVLAVSLSKVRLFSGSRDGLAECTPAELRFDMDEALALDMERQLQMHSHQPRPRTRSGTETGAYHGHEDVDLKKYIRQYFQKIDQALGRVLSGEDAPMVFAGVEYLFPIYRDASRYSALTQESLTGNFDGATARELHGDAWEIVQPGFEKHGRMAESRLQEALGTRMASTELTELLPAAVNGRIEALFVQAGKSVWGRYDHECGRLQVHASSTAANDDIINLLATLTLQHGGEVFVLERGTLPRQSNVAALFRFAAVEPAASVLVAE
jgi:hypothetical protein